MKKERYWPVLGKWMKDTVTAPPDPQETADKVAEQVTQMPQVRRRWWLPSMRRTPAHPSNSKERIAHQPSPIAATRGHTPTATGRTQSMFSPVKAIAAGALVFALGGAFLLAQPFDQQESIVPGADTEAVPATWVTGTIKYASSCKDPTPEVDGPVRHEWGIVCEPQTWTTSDPRLSGEAAALWNMDVYEPDAYVPTALLTTNVSVVTSAYEVRNEAGGWTCHANGFAHGHGKYAESESGESAMCVGDGEYDGLSATLVIGGPAGPKTIEGLIFSGDFPPVPERPAAE
jgi:hypothetical protein